MLALSLAQLSLSLLYLMGYGQVIVYRITEMIIRKIFDNNLIILVLVLESPAG